MPRRAFVGGLAATAGLAASPFGSALAQTYPNRRFQVVIPTGQGGGAERIARPFDAAWGQILKTQIEYSFFPGAAGQIGYELYVKRRPRDGHNFLFGNMGAEMLMYALQRPDYNFPRDYIYFSQVEIDDSCIYVNRNSPFKTIEDVKARQMVVAGTGAGSETDTWPVVLNEVLGTKFKLVTGYLGSQETILAIERGEAHGRCVLSHSALKTAKPDWLREKKINVLVVTALEQSPDFPGVPAVVDLVGKPDDRQLLELMVGPGAMARPFAAPPAIPLDRKAALIAAFDATMKDPKFLADAKRMHIDPDPMTGEEVQKAITEAYKAPKDVVALAAKLWPPPTSEKE
ncbi:MAG: Bug family tripartite tricarboxylate transporter substrate binding protein [Burkholderiales bacterium]